MAIQVEDIDDILVGNTRIILAIGSRRFLFDHLSPELTHKIRKERDDGSLAQSAEVSRMISKINVQNDSVALEPMQKNVVTLSSRTVTKIATPLAAIAAFPLSVMFLTFVVGALIIAFGQGIGGIWGKFFRDMAWYDLAFVLLFYFASVFVHEFGHAALCLRKTGLVGPIKVRIHRGLPVFTTDVSSLCFASGSDQAKIAAAGAAFQIGFASLLLIIPVPALQLAGILALFAAIFSLLPLPGSDGFWFLNDLFGLDLPRFYKDSPFRKKALHVYTVWLVTTSIVICAAVLYFGYLGLWRLAGEARTPLLDAALWLIYIAYTALVLKTYALRNWHFLRDGGLRRWNSRTGSPA